MRKAFGLLWFFCAIAGYAQTGTEQEAAKYYNSGVAFYNSSNYTRAVADFTQAIRLDLNNADCYYWRGLAYVERSRSHAFVGDRGWVNVYWKESMERAIADLETVLRLAPNHKNTREKLEDTRGRAARGPVMLPTELPPTPLSVMTSSPL